MGRVMHESCLFRHDRLSLVGGCVIRKKRCFSSRWAKEGKVNRRITPRPRPLSSPCLSAHRSAPCPLRKKNKNSLIFCQTGKTDDVPVWKALVAPAAPTTQGRPYSLATTAPWEMRPPSSVTTPPRRGKYGLQPMSVLIVIRISPFNSKNMWKRNQRG